MEATDEPRPWIWNFGGNNTNSGTDHFDKNLLGGKGANLAAMSALGLPVPPGFTITTEVCNRYPVSDISDGIPEGWPPGLEGQVKEALVHLERSANRSFGGLDNGTPLLVSVRSGAAESMPGMMDTILNLGLNDKTVDQLAGRTGNVRFAYDCYSRLIEMFGSVVMGIPSHHFTDTDTSEPDNGHLDVDSCREHIHRLKQVYRDSSGFEFPDDPYEQLRIAVHAVLRSWYTPRAVSFRKINRITGLAGTAVTIQAMVFGNTGQDSATGVCFTRNPSDGTQELFGEFLLDAQGEDVVDGSHTPRPISDLEQIMPEAYRDLIQVGRRLELHFRDMQDIEFTIEQGKLYLLQTRNGKRSGRAAIRIAVDMAGEGIVTEQEAVMKLVEPQHIEQFLHAGINTDSVPAERILARGIAASPGGAVGRIVFHSDKVKASEEPVILVRQETNSDDIDGMFAARGVVTCQGGKTSHAAVVARGWGKPCVCGCSELRVDPIAGTLSNGSITLKEGDWISIDGNRGWVISGRVELKESAHTDDFVQFMSWVDRCPALEVRANADTRKDAERALQFGAKGIGLCRTEHMFFTEGRVRDMRRMILALDEEERNSALENLLHYQQEDFVQIFRAMDGLPVTIRLLDPPLHEFLPEGAIEIEQLAGDLDMDPVKVRQRVESLHEYNPMLGHRGCRLGITFPEISQMQARAIFQAAVLVASEGKIVIPEVMIPLVGSAEEFLNQRRVVDEQAKLVFESAGRSVSYRVGTMIEVPRAALLAADIAEHADFFSFGTNDLTQMTFGFSRDDIASFMPSYLEKGVLTFDPFQTLDRKGVGQLLSLAVERGRSTRSGLKIGICGEHGGDPDSIDFFHQCGMDYVSCSPFRVPVARLAAAQAGSAPRDSHPAEPSATPVLVPT